MWNYVILLVLYIYKCSCVNEDEIFNLSDPSTESMSFNLVEGGLHYYTVNFQSSRKILVVVDNDQIIWESDVEGRVCKSLCYHKSILSEGLLLLEIANDDGEEYNLYFGCRENQWIVLTEGFYMRRLPKLVSQREFDINNGSKVLKMERRYTSCGNIMISCLSNDLFKIVKVIDGNNVIWCKNNNETKCKQAISYIRNNKPILLYLDVIINNNRSEKRYLLLLNNEWELVTEPEYRNIKYIILNEIFLDLSVLDLTSDFETTEIIRHGLIKRNFIAYSTVYVTKVLWFNDIIWNANNIYEKCKIATVYIKNQHPILIYLLINAPGDIHLYFARYNGAWIRVSRSIFLGHLSLQRS